MSRESLHRDMFEHGLFGNVAEGHVLEFDFARPLDVSGRAVCLVEVFPRPRARVLVRFDDIAVFVLSCVDESDVAFVFFGFLINEFKNAFSACKSHQYAVHLLRDLRERIAELARELHKRYETAPTHSAKARDCHNRADDCGHGVGNVGQVAHNREQNVGIGVRLV